MGGRHVKNLPAFFGARRRINVSPPKKYQEEVEEYQPWIYIT
jgi:hypothetical protein